MFEVRQFLARDGTNPFLVWFKRLRDPKAKISIVRRLNRISQGNLGDHKSVGEGVWELRIDTGPGYRIYYGVSGKVVILLLYAGDKSTQGRDIEIAKENWLEWQIRQTKGE
jgi:putative addiction module killer protein